MNGRKKEKKREREQNKNGEDRGGRLLILMR